MTKRVRGQAIWILFSAHLAQGAALLTRPRVVLNAVARTQDTPPAWVARVLGIRMLAQAAAEGIRPSRGMLRTAVAVDLAHAASMVGAARFWPRYRRTALASAVSAGVSAVAGSLLGSTRP
jgi:hypothetical protein